MRLLFFDEPEIREVYVVPNFISEGYFTQTVIPRELQLDGRLTTRATGQVWKYCEPVGNHPAVTELLLRRAREVAPGVPPAETSLLIVGPRHGTERQQRDRGEARGGKDRRARPLRLGPERLHGGGAAHFRLGAPNENAKRGGRAVFHFRRAAQLPGHPGFARDRARTDSGGEPTRDLSPQPASASWAALFTMPAPSGPSRNLPKSSWSRRQLSIGRPLISAQFRKAVG